MTKTKIDIQYANGEEMKWGGWRWKRDVLKMIGACWEVKKKTTANRCMIKYFPPISSSEASNWAVI